MFRLIDLFKCPDLSKTLIDYHYSLITISSGEMPDGTDYQKLDTHESWDDTDRKITQMGYLGWRPKYFEVQLETFKRELLKNYVTRLIA